MFYIKKIVISSLNKSGVKVVSSIDLKAGLNIIHGPSNTGKTLILDCIDLMLGGEAKRLYKKELGIRSISMLLDADGAEISMTRELGTNDVTVLSGYAPVESGTYTTGNATLAGRAGQLLQRPNPKASWLALRRRLCRRSPDRHEGYQGRISTAAGRLQGRENRHGHHQVRFPVCE